MKKLFMAVIALMMTISASAQFYIYCSDGNVIKVDSIIPSRWQGPLRTLRATSCSPSECQSPARCLAHRGCSGRIADEWEDE